MTALWTRDRTETGASGSSYGRAINLNGAGFFIHSIYGDGFGNGDGYADGDGHGDGHMNGDGDGGGDGDGDIRGYLSDDDGRAYGRRGGNVQSAGYPEQMLDSAKVVVTRQSIDCPALLVVDLIALAVAT